MKKTPIILFVAAVLCLLCACGNTENAPDSTVSSSGSGTLSESASENVVISVNKELVADETVFLTDISEIGGITSTMNDNFYVLTMSQESYKNLLKSKSQEVIDEYELLSRKGEYIEDIDYSEDFREIKVYVNRQKYDAVDSATQQMQLITIGAKAMSYQMFLTEGQKTLVSAVYSETEETAFTISLPIEM